MDKKKKLDKQSIESFWSNVPIKIREKSESLGFEPYANLQFDKVVDTITGQTKYQFFATAKHLGLWFKNIYPDSIIQTEKCYFEVKPILTANGQAVVDVQGKPMYSGLCQYRVKIKLNGYAEWNIIEGPIVSIGQSYYGYTVTINNLTTTAETKAIRRAYEILGISDNSDKSDEYFYEQPNLQVTKAEKPKKTHKKSAKIKKSDDKATEKKEVVSLNTKISGTYTISEVKKENSNDSLIADELQDNSKKGKLMKENTDEQKYYDCEEFKFLQED